MQVVGKEIPRARLFIVGDGEERNRLNELVTNLQLQQTVIFLGHRQDTVPLFNCFDVGVLCSRDECHSISLLEGMACELPFVATAVGGNPEIISDNENGLLVPSGQPEILADIKLYIY